MNVMEIKIGLLEFPKITNLTNQENLCIKCRITGNENKFRNTGKTYQRAEQVKRCGNAVCPPIPAALVKANLPELCKAERQPICRPDRIQTERNGQLKFA